MDSNPSICSKTTIPVQNAQVCFQSSLLAHLCSPLCLPHENWGKLFLITLDLKEIELREVPETLVVYL